MIIKKCIVCDKDFRFRNAPSDIKHGGGKYCSKNCQNKNMSSVLINRGIRPIKRFIGYNEHNPNWKGNDVSYSGLHYWIARKLGKPKKCEKCGTTEAKVYDWANISKEYKRDLLDWIRLCRSCHHRFDGSRYKMWQTIKRKRQERINL